MFDKPFYVPSKFQPNPIVFRITWSILYGFLFVTGIALLQTNNILLICLFIFQLFLNLIWTFVLFHTQNLWVSFCIIIAIFLITCYIFAESDRPVQLLLIPYLLWLAFASFLMFDTSLANEIHPMTL